MKLVPSSGHYLYSFTNCIGAPRDLSEGDDPHLLQGEGFCADFFGATETDSEDGDAGNTYMGFGSGPALNISSDHARADHPDLFPEWSSMVGNDRTLTPGSYHSRSQVNSIPLTV